ncbi:MAG: response regulator [Alphaproteobacteria bacterium]|nr:response regulator [Alphaproteobacteria bacterium]MBV9693486.1 response regulator [Alphaproteobacteria bacterium]
MSKLTVCIVDDDSAVRESLRMILERADYEVRCFASGRIFLSQGDLSQCGCLLLDQYMPGLSGTTLLERLKSCGTAGRTILMTGANAEELRPTARAAGALAVLQKPMAAGDLLPWIDRAMAAPT